MTLSTRKLIVSCNEDNTFLQVPLYLYGRDQYIHQAGNDFWRWIEQEKMNLNNKFCKLEQ